MNVEAVTIRPLVRPQFDNTQLAERERWFLDNVRVLARLWIEQSTAIGQAATENMEDFDLWLLCQHDIEMALRGPVAKLPHGFTL